MTPKDNLAKQIAILLGLVAVLHRDNEAMEKELMEGEDDKTMESLGN